MDWPGKIAHEIFGLFVDDGSFVLAILVWIGVVWLALHFLRSPVPGGVLLFAGLALALVENVTRFARRAAK